MRYINLRLTYLLTEPARGKLVTLVTCKWCHLLFMGDRHRSVYDKKPEHYAEDNKTEF